MPSVATALIEKLPSETDPTRADEELVAVNTASVTYLGEQWINSVLEKPGLSHIYVSSGGADTVR